jgi:hypothetical protein
MPQLYLGFHYPTEILSGALIGITLAKLFCDRVGLYSMPRLKRSPGSFYACLFILTFEIATLFQSAIHRSFFIFPPDNRINLTIEKNVNPHLTF